MKIFDRLREELHHTRLAHRNRRRIRKAKNRWEVEPNLTNKAVLAMQIGGMYESRADHLEASRLTRITMRGWTPAALQNVAAMWQSRSDYFFAAAKNAR